MEAGVHSVLKGSRTLSWGSGAAAYNNPHVIAWHSLDIHYAEWGGFLFGPNKKGRGFLVRAEGVGEVFLFGPNKNHPTPSLSAWSRFSNPTNYEEQGCLINS